ncbi:MAG: pyrophosphatase PpaX [Candidatus Micrarchaeota archaeon]|nr:MAG: pyrophosphatase PpaX [Candidatus Micrarchaeota archaeon]
MSLNDYKHYIFDWDGTIIRIRALFAINQIKKRINVSNLLYDIERDKEKILNRYRNNSREYKVINRDVKRLESLFIDIVTLFYRPRLQYKARDVLDSLLYNKKYLYILTDANPYRIKKELDLFKLYNRFRAVVSTQLFNAFKPDTKALMYIMHKYNIHKDRALYIGDSIYDIIMAQAYGIDQCAVSNGIDSYENLKRLEPTYIFHSMEELYRALR